MPTASNSIQSLLEDERTRRAFEFFADHADQITNEQISICTIAAPPFGEANRAEFMRRRFAELGLNEAKIDAEGNVLALRRGRSERPLLVVSAHLDTVFAAETDLTVRREDSKIFAPGIMDDACGLVALVALAEALQKFQIETSGTILFVATVGEEAAGNLRGVRHLFLNGEFAGRIDAFVSLDGAGVQQIVNAALGSRRYKIMMSGSGGHSWLDFGAANPVHALGRAVAKLAAYPLPKKHKTTFNVGRIAGGASVNVIPETAEIEVDLRSESEAELQRLDAFFRRAVAEAVEEENAARSPKSSPLEIESNLTGTRPSGITAETDALVKAAIEATLAVGVEPSLAMSSTDSNFPMSLNIPSVTLGAGGAGDKMHTLGEWFDPTGREIGLQRALLLILAHAGI